MSIEVIIPTFERLEPLQRTLAGLAAQTLRDFSVAVVDDCSRVPVADVLQPSRYPFAIRMLHTPANSGPAVARNLGVQSSEATLIAFIDDDVVPDPDALAAHAGVIDRHGYQAVSIGPLRAPADWEPTPWNRWEAESLRLEYERIESGVYQATWRQFFTGNAMLARAAFLSGGCFDPRFKRAEDIEFAYRLHKLGGHFVFEPKAIGWHYAERTLASWRRMARQYAEFDAAIDQLHPELGWSHVVEREQRQRHPLTRAVDHAVGMLGLELPASTVSVGLARLSHAGGAHAMSQRLLSLSFQLEYRLGQRSVPRRQRFNPPSTDTA